MGGDRAVNLLRCMVSFRLLEVQALRAVILRRACMTSTQMGGISVVSGNTSTTAGCSASLRPARLPLIQNMKADVTYSRLKSSELRMQGESDS